MCSRPREDCAAAPAAGPLRINEVCPSSTDVLQTSDNCFHVGGVGRGDATLTVNDAPVRQRRYARGVAGGISEFLRARARDP